MKAANRKFSRFLACALVFLLVLTAALPVFAEPANKNLDITIHNNTGLPEMKADQFKVYQLFSGTPYRDGDAKNPEWGAGEWNNWSLADVQWGKSVKNGATLLAALKALTKTTAPWMGDTNPFAGAQNAADVADVLAEHSENKFMQGFADFLLNGTTGGYLEALPASDVNGRVNDPNNTPKDYSDDTLTYTVPDTGYYLFAETASAHTVEDAVSEYIIAVMGDQDINLKASVPTVDKNIVSGEDRLKGDAVGISDTVIYELTGTLPKNFGDFDSYKYVFHDTLSKGLDYAANMKVTVVLTVGGKEQTYEIAVNATTGYQVVTHTVTEDATKEDPREDDRDIPANVGKTFIDVTFADLKKLLGTLTPGGDAAAAVPFDTVAAYDTDVKIVVTYNATVNSDAAIGKDGNPNDVYLEYSNDPNHNSTGHTTEKRVIVYSFALDLTKTGSDKPEGLSGAGFVLSKTDAEGNIYYAQFENVLDEESLESPKPVIGRRLKGWVKQANPADAKKGEADVAALIDTYETAKKELDKATNETKTEAESNLKTAKDNLASYLLESGSAGKIPAVTGMDAGDYTLTEVITPAGYNTMAAISFTITAVTQTEVEGADPKPELTVLSATLAAEDARGDVEFTPNADLESGHIYGTLQNQKAPFLPFTGGIGTLIFYMLGIALIAGAVTYLVVVSKKSKKTKENA